MNTYEAFASLNQFQSARKSLAQAKKHLPELGSIICRHKLENKVAISLLHKHFDIHPGERVTKTLSSNFAQIRPVNFRSSSSLTPYLWRFAEDAGGLHALEFFADETSEYQPVSKEIESNAPFLLEMSQALRKRNLNDIFGISLVHMNDLDEELIWLETTDSKQRILTIEQVSKSSADDELTETTWTFTINRSALCERCTRPIELADPPVEPPKDKPWKKEKPLTEPNADPSVMCTFHCHQHCHQHCKQHCQDHGRKGES